MVGVGHDDSPLRVLCDLSKDSVDLSLLITVDGDADAVNRVAGLFLLVEESH